MSLHYIITKFRDCKQYRRQLVIRAIEDGIILFLMGVGIWAVCWIIGGVLRILGVA